MWWIEFHKTPLGGSLSTGRWKTLAVCVVAISSKGLQSLVRSGKLWISPLPGRPYEAAFLCMGCQCGPVFHKPYDGEPGAGQGCAGDTSRGFAGPNYSGALRDGDLTTRLERCTGWVKAEASEAASLIESCVPPWQADACSGSATPGCSGIVEDVAGRLPSTIFGSLDDPTLTRQSRRSQGEALLNQSPRSSSGCSGSSG